MTERQTIVVGTDGSEASQAAVRWAAGEAQRRNAGLQVLHAYEEIWGTADYVTDRTVIEIARNHAEEIVANARLAAQAVAPDITVHADAVLGEPSSTLLDAAASAAIVVIANRGRGGFTSLLLGSVGQRVATHAPCPTVVVRGHATAAEGRIVVGADGSAAGAHALQLAFEEATARRCPLIAIRAYELPLPPGKPGIPPLISSPEVYDAAERNSLDESLAAWRDKYPTVSVETTVVRGNPARVLVGASHTAQLVIVGSRGHGGLAGTLLGSVGLKLLHHADCPVLIARA